MLIKIFTVSTVLDVTLKYYSTVHISDKLLLFQGVRRNVCRQLAEALIHGISDFQYVAPDAESPRRTPSRQSNESPWKPRKHAGGSTVFTPQSKQEEIILVLLLSENMASKEAVLSQSPEYAESRKRTYEQATAVYDLMAIVLSRYVS